MTSPDSRRRHWWLGYLQHIIHKRTLTQEASSTASSPDGQPPRLEALHFAPIAVLPRSIEEEMIAQTPARLDREGMQVRDLTAVQAEDIPGLQSIPDSAETHIDRIQSPPNLRAPYNNRSPSIPQNVTSRRHIGWVC